MRTSLLSATLVFFTGCAPSIAKTGLTDGTVDNGGGDGSDGDATGATGDGAGDGTGNGSTGETGSTNGADGGGGDGGSGGSGDGTTDPVFAYSGDYSGTIRVDMGWPDWDGNLSWQELCTTDISFTVGEDGVWSASSSCDAYFGGGRPTPVDMELAGDITDAGDVTGSIAYDVQGWITGIGEVAGSASTSGLDADGNTTIDLGRGYYAEAVFTLEMAR